MKNLLLYINGLCLSSIYITSPLLIPSLYNKDVNLRPLSVHDALLITNSAKKATTFNVSENNGTHNNSFGTVSTDINTQNIPTATINNFVYLLTSYIMGKAIGQYLFTKRTRISLAIRSIPLVGRLLLLQSSRGSRILPPWRIACISVSILVSLVIITGKSGVSILCYFYEFYVFIYESVLRF